MSDPDLAALVPGYLARRRQDCAAMRGWLEAGDLERVRALGHRLKGSGATFGLPEVSALGARLEQAAVAGDRQAAGSALDELEAFLREAR